MSEGGRGGCRGEGHKYFLNEEWESHVIPTAKERREGQKIYSTQEILSKTIMKSD